MMLVITWVRFLEGHKPSPSFCICSLWLSDGRIFMCKNLLRTLQMKILWCAKLEPVLKPPDLTSVTDVSWNMVFSKGGGGGGWSCEDCAGGRPGSYPGHSHKTVATVAESWHPLHRGAGAHSSAPAVHPATISRDSLCNRWNKVHKVLELITGGFLLLFYLRQEGNYASCIRSKEFELFYYLVLMKAEQMGWHVWKYQICEGWNGRASTLRQFHPAQRCLWEGYEWQAGHFSGTAHFCTDVNQCVS